MKAMIHVFRFSLCALLFAGVAMAGEHGFDPDKKAQEHEKNAERLREEAAAKEKMADEKGLTAEQMQLAREMIKVMQDRATVQDKLAKAARAKNTSMYKEALDDDRPLIEKCQRITARINNSKKNETAGRDDNRTKDERKAWKEDQRHAEERKADTRVTTVESEEDVQRWLSEDKPASEAVKN